MPWSVARRARRLALRRRLCTARCSFPESPALPSPPCGCCIRRCVKISQRAAPLFLGSGSCLLFSFYPPVLGISCGAVLQLGVKWLDGQWQHAFAPSLSSLVAGVAVAIQGRAKHGAALASSMALGWCDVGVVVGLGRQRVHAGAWCRVPLCLYRPCLSQCASCASVPSPTKHHGPSGLKLGAGTRTAALYGRRQWKQPATQPVAFLPSRLRLRCVVSRPPSPSSCCPLTTTAVGFSSCYAMWLRQCWSCPALHNVSRPLGWKKKKREAQKKKRKEGRSLAQ